jgi:hypothetical protein
MTWHGWCRGPDGRWLRLASGPTLDACHRRLLQEIRRRGLDRAERVMTTGGVPDNLPFSLRTSAARPAGGERAAPAGTHMSRNGERIDG